MITDWWNGLVAGDWAVAFLRLMFIGGIYLFLFVVLRATARELAAVARSMAPPEGEPARLALEVMEGSQSSLRPGMRLALPAVASIGRGVDNDIVIDDAHISANHAEIRRDRGQWWLRDLESSNGTKVNGKSVRTVVALQPGDILEFAGVRLRLVSSRVGPVADLIST